MNFLSTLSLLFANLINFVTAVFRPSPSLMMIRSWGVSDKGGGERRGGGEEGESGVGRIGF